MAKKITTGERRRMDHLRREGLKVGAIYAKRLARLRRAQVRKVLGLCEQVDDVGEWEQVIFENLDETGYWQDWTTGLYMAAGVPRAKAVVADLTRKKAAVPGDAWVTGLRNYAASRAGEEIVSVTGTLRDSLIEILRGILEEEVEMGVEKLTKRVLGEYDELAPWQVRRIAQTETMVGMAEASGLAVQTLDVRFTKQWCCSGLANTRETHLVMDGVTVDENDYFELPDCRMLWPHDNSLNPPAGEIINCACDVIRRPK